MVPNWCGDFKDSRTLRETLGAPSDGFASCAVVGSSGILNLERLGERIERSELVIRFNLQGVHGYEPIVGRRTSLRSINSEAIGFILAEHRRDIHAGGGTLRRFRNASWCPTYPVYLNSGQPLHLSAFRAVCSGVTTIIDDSVFDEHKAVLKSLGPQDANLMSGQLGVALATMLCPKGVDVYGFTHAGSQKIAQEREVPYHYFDANAQLNAQFDSLDDSARLLSLFAEAQPGCVRLWTPSAGALVSPFKTNVSRRGTGDPFVDAIRSESEAREDVQAYAEERALRAAICESGPVMKALGDCSTPFPPVVAVLVGCLLLTSLCAIRAWRVKEAAREAKATENSGLLARGPSTAG